MPLTEDEIDDLLYIARANETSELEPYLSYLSHKHNTTPSAILLSAIDPENKNTPLHYASANAHLSLLKSLLGYFSSDTDSEAKSILTAFVNRQNEAGNTALHWASLNGHLAIVKELVANGADAAILNAAGHDAVFEAERTGKDEVVEWLLKEGGGLEMGVGGGVEEEGEAEDIVEDGGGTGGGESSGGKEDGVDMDIDRR
jgi:ankyrin repeat protein